MNVRTITLTSEEEQYGVKYKAYPDNKAIGLKYRQQAAKIRTALPKIPSETIKSFRSCGYLDVEGVRLTQEELSVQPYFDESSGLSHLESNSDRDVLILLDMTRDETLVQEGLARELINRVQRLRKKAGLNPTDEVDVYYEMLTDVEEQLSQMMVGQTEVLGKSLKRQPINKKQLSTHPTIEEEQEINGSKFLLSLLKL